MGARHPPGRGYHDTGSVAAALTLLVEKITRRMRASDRLGHTVVLRLRFADYLRVTRSRPLPADRPARPRRGAR
ncbi:MAG: hypothetical protein WAX14_08150 [Rhodococcus sp. (in: high G+C Gram-positive bacteria)]|uniref:DinB/UmuC family translesion DNA polymerase n=1 Tax=Rhodococcus sp. TaxID=1831 RepID=UPI003BB63E3B